MNSEPRLYNPTEHNVWSYQLGICLVHHENHTPLKFHWVQQDMVHHATNTLFWKKKKEKKKIKKEKKKKKKLGTMCTTSEYNIKKKSYLMLVTPVHTGSCPHHHAHVVFHHYLAAHLNYYSLALQYV